MWAVNEHDMPSGWLLGSHYAGEDEEKAREVFDSLEPGLDYDRGDIELVHDGRLVERKTVVPPAGSC